MATTPLLVTSASGAHGDGFGALLAFGIGGSFLGVFSNDSRIADPRGLAVNQSEGLLFLNSGSDRVLALNSDGVVVRDTGQIKALNPGGGIVGPDGRYYLGSRSERTVMVFSSQLDAVGQLFPARSHRAVSARIAFGRDGRLFLASGIGPNGAGDNAIVAFDLDEREKPLRLVSDPELSPLDLAIAPNGNIVVSSEASIWSLRCSNDGS